MNIASASASPATVSYMFSKRLAATAAAIAALFYRCRKFCAETKHLRLIVCLLGIRQQPFKSVDALLKVDSLFEIHRYFTLRPSL